jgi:hypothetical protein
VASLVLGILWIGWLGSVLAVVFGLIALSQTKARRQSGRGLAIAGVALGWTAVVVGLVVALVVVVGHNDRLAQVHRGPSPTHLVAGPTLVRPRSLYLANPPGSAALVTSAQADQVARTMWNRWEEAQIQRNTTALTELVAPGPILRSELLQCAWPTGGCVPETRPRPIFSLESVVPLQRTYPIYFLAQVATNEYVGDNFGTNDISRWVELQVLTKAGPTTPWKLSFDAGYDGVHSPPPEMAFDQQGAGAPVAGAAPPLLNPAPTNTGPVGPARFLPLLAAYWQSWKDAGAAPAHNLFRNDGDTSGFGQEIAGSRQGNTEGGYEQQYHYSFDRDAGSWLFSAYGGYPVECGTVEVTDTATPVDGIPLEQGSDRTDWGMALAPGLYSRIVTTNTHQSCVYAADGALLDAAGGTTSNITEVTGTPTP